MKEISHYLETIQPELVTTARLFGMEQLLDGFPGHAPLQMKAEETESVFRVTFSDGTETVSREAPLPDAGSAGTGPQPLPDEGTAGAPGEAFRIRELHRKRAARRLCKQALYDFCRKKTGVHPPWGSLTGVRPTHLMLEALSEGLSPEAAVQRLIRDFDVTEEKARLLARIAQVQAALPAPGDSWMDVYIGIPFCTTRCAYCSFSSGEIGSGKLVRPYLDALFREMEAGAEILAESGRHLRAVYVGGGTPTSLPEKAFRELLRHMTDFFPGAMEYTVEAGRPDTLNREKLRTVREAGVRRISINPQTMNDRTLRVIGRAHTALQVREAYALAREEQIPHINMDVIAGLPGESLSDFARTMEEAVLLSPESLTVHTLAIKRSSPWGERQTADRLKRSGAAGSRSSAEPDPRTADSMDPGSDVLLPPGEVAAEMVRLGGQTAEHLGMRPYYLYKQKYMAGNLENTGYALPGHECVYNVDIMEETSHILALGAGGISKRIYPEEGHIGRAPNVSHIETYIARLEEMIRRKRELFLTDQAI